MVKLELSLLWSWNSIPGQRTKGLTISPWPPKNSDMYGQERQWVSGAGWCLLLRPCLVITKTEKDVITKTDERRKSAEEAEIQERI